MRRRRRIGRVPDLADHVQDRAAGQRVEARARAAADVDLVADHGADERGAAADEPGERTASARTAAPRRAARRCRSPRSRCAGAKPMISAVARPISPARAETPIASPSAKLCRPIATAISMPSVSDARSASRASSWRRDRPAHADRVDAAARHRRPACGARCIWCSIQARPSAPARIPAVPITARAANVPPPPAPPLRISRRRLEDRVRRVEHVPEDERAGCRPRAPTGNARMRSLKPPAAGRWAIRGRS